jgi:hypothetical protein
MEEVFIEVVASDTVGLGYIDWDTIDRILARPNFARLTRILFSVKAIGFHVELSGLREQTLSWLAERLPACHTRCILDVEVTYRC